MPSVVEFHVRLFGVEIHERNRRLYEAFERDGSRGFDSDTQNLGDLQATVVLALFQARANFDETGLKSKDPITIFTPEAWSPAVLKGLEPLLRGLVRVRKGNERAIRLITDAFKLLRIGTKPKLLPEAPEKWVSFGFTSDSPAPLWLRKRLLKIPKDSV